MIYYSCSLDIGLKISLKKCIITVTCLITTGRWVLHCDQLVWLGWSLLYSHQPQRCSTDKQWHLTGAVCISTIRLSLLKDDVCHHSFNMKKSFGTRLRWFSFPHFSPKQWIPQTLRICVGMLHCDSPIWTHTDTLMITEQDSQSRTQSSFTEHWPVSSLQSR